MSMCPKCGKVLEDGMRFCDNCGTQILEAAVCPNCGERVVAGYAFCQKCGAPVGQTPNPGAGYSSIPNTGYVADPPGAGYTSIPNTGYVADPPGAGYTSIPNTGYVPDSGAGYTPNPNTGYVPDSGAGYTPNPDPVPNSAAAASPQKKGGIPKLPFILGGAGIAAVALIVVLVLVISRFVGSGGTKSGDAKYMLYLKDHEIFYLDLKKNDNMEVTSRLLNSSMSDAELADDAYSLGYFIAFSENGNRIFYPDRLDRNSNGITLYYRDINKPNEDPVKIDSDITTYAVNKAGTRVVYLKGPDGGLYTHDLESKDKIANNVEAFTVADDCKKVLYLTEDESIYLWYADKDKVKLASDISGVEYVSDDLSVIYYTKDGALYKQAEGDADREKIASDVYRAVKIYDSGELYYVKSETVEISLMDYVYDDLAASDAAMTEPEAPNYPEAPHYPSWFDTDGEGNYLYETEEELQAARDQYRIDYVEYEKERNRLYEEYRDAYHAYQDKVSRDSFRETLRENTMELTQYTLYYYDGTEGSVVADGLSSAWNFTCAEDTAILLVQTSTLADMTKPKFSEISSTYEVSSLINEAFYSSTEPYIAVRAAMTALDQSDASYFRVSYDGSAIYFLDDISDRDEGDLYKITITDGQPGRPELYDSDVSTSYMYFLPGDQLMYYKDVDVMNWKGDLYIDKVEIDYDVRLSYVTQMGDAVLYYTDWSSEKGYGTLKMYNNGEKVKIADDVHSFVTTNDNDILYLYDYSSNYYKGTLYRYNGGDPVKIDDDVMALLPVSGSKVKGSSYYYFNW